MVPSWPSLPAIPAVHGTVLRAKSSQATTTQPHVQRKRLGSAQTLGLAPTRSTYLRRPLRRPRLGLSTMFEHPHPLSLSPCCDSQHHTADSNKARSVRHDAAGHMGELGLDTPPQDGRMEAASVWRGGDSHRSGPVVIPAQQISDLPAEQQAGDKGHAHHGRNRAPATQRLRFFT